MSRESDPSGLWVAVTPSDSTDLFRNGKPPRGLHVGVAGNLSLRGTNGVTVVFKNCIAGMYYPYEAKHVMAATTATDIVALY